MKPIQGLHHITVMGSNAQENLTFYEQVLGQRLVKKTVNFDDPGTYHLYYGDKTGTPGTIMTFFPWPRMHKGTAGNGETTAVAYAIRKGSLSYWKTRLADHGIKTSDILTRMEEPYIRFLDPDGMTLELIETNDPSTIQSWNEGPVPAEHALRGFHSVTLQLRQAAPTASVLTDVFGYVLSSEEGNRMRFKAASNDRGLYIDLLEMPEGRQGRFGAGSIHHIAFRTVDDSEQLAYRSLLEQAGHPVTPVKDRQYFHSIYFREPGGVLFEIATDAPGFAYDEAIEELGNGLKLPSWLESKRSEIESVLPPIQRNQNRHEQ